MRGPGMMSDAERLDIVNTFGAAYIGSMVTLVMYGITTLQTYFYFLRFPKDERSLKVLVSIVWVLDTIHIIFVCHAMYYYLITNYNNPPGLVDGTWSLYTSVALNVLIAFIVQCFFTKRIYILSSLRVRWWLTSVTALSVLGHFALGMETVVELFLKKELSRLSEITLNSALPFALLAVLSDILVAGALCGLLWNNRSDFKDTNSLVNNLIIWAINRCLLTSFVAIAEVIAFAIRPMDFWFLAIDFVIGKLYANSLLATLNTRASVRAKDGDPESGRSDEVSTSFQLASAVRTDNENAFSRNLLRVGPTHSSMEESTDMESTQLANTKFDGPSFP
ncbi:hypothetical protein JAAARDRAFT_207512 [Jaapia argillacea MUCL 33604]|uniref:DUF6534 domain-containing protein n=1 Tax=Jaapia argillacea MUCL 33604 TaxID=933084 RepID=A0A067Q123_9AGAM|nr:hypothetical protein JAAARDRAFT_207512 [Jaapia argillacea MUCL 33604]